MKNEWNWLEQKEIDEGHEATVELTRKCKEDACTTMKAWSPSTPGPPAWTKLADPPWTPGEWRELESDSSDEESEVDPMKVYNDAISQIASLSDIKEVEPLSFRLTSNWEEATRNEKLLCEEKVDQACRAVQCPGLITIKEVDERGFFAVTPRRMKVPSLESDEKQVLFECKEPGCSSVFATFDELQDHTHFGEHGLNVRPQEGIYDHLCRQWAFKFSTLSLADDSKEKNQPADEERATPKAGWKPEAEEVEYLNDKRRNEEIDDICNQVALVHPIMYDGYDLCEHVRLDKLSQFTVLTLKAMCKHFELSYKSKDNKSCLMNKIKDMVRECSCGRPGPTD
ncbi:hypothetical protein OS493_012889 [Desmophyllum pertusum]|uniref:C2H2-type domain-containing protein n=1 Tax=Desmophyllum pertusum TaxID=174260 RepID=A0A9W9Z406_9CNID|nr:hypothetical protein OS493_012889 [Desmophyllum pertusum]